MVPVQFFKLLLDLLRVVRSRGQVERYDLNCRMLRNYFVTLAMQNVRHGNLCGIV